MGVCLIAGAKDKAIQDFILDEQTVYVIPVSGFREEVVAALPRQDADKLIELCQTTSSPRVSFETAQSKTS